MQRAVVHKRHEQTSRQTSKRPRKPARHRVGGSPAGGMANQAAPPAFKDLTESEYQKVVSKPVVQSCDMVPAEQANEAVEVISMAVDKHVSTGNYEAMCKIVKETMDRKYGPQWHCAIGEGFGFDVTYQQPNMIYVYYGKIGILLFKC